MPRPPLPNKPVQRPPAQTGGPTTAPSMGTLPASVAPPRQRREPPSMMNPRDPLGGRGGQDLSNVTYQNGQAGIMGRGGNFQALGQNAQGRLPNAPPPPFASGPPMIRPPMNIDWAHVQGGSGDNMGPRIPPWEGVGPNSPLRNLLHPSDLIMDPTAQPGQGGGNDINSAISNMRQALGRGTLDRSAGGAAMPGGQMGKPSMGNTGSGATPIANIGGPSPAPLDPKMMSAQPYGAPAGTTAGPDPRAQFNNRFNQLIARGRGAGGGRMGGG